MEEEVIEGEEFEAAPHSRRHKPEVHDLDDYEEETIPTHLRTGDLGEMLQEAHLDHRIQLNFDEKGVEEEFETAEEEEEAATASPACARTRAPRSRDRRAAASVAAESRAIAADPRAARHRPPTCPSSPTC